ncbi:isochorismatase family cysteine hydrolase [Micromonospora halophytica]|uniref:Nicotinamidase-related amidase n=1 Tax=Micromonospora halophytica TaxID=47864 RepID=A0A1C5GWP2_9ACTN|nr:isochorismatase family cysteine hydrolase [Micromonospora halophytica]SCG38170.1 Nicotinamidase-related amidase [Micromonospora halophytica]
MSSTWAALIVIDMQNGFINDQSRHVIPKVVELVERWEATGRPVVFTRYHNYPDSPFERLIHWSKVQHAPETEIVPELAPHVPRARAVIDKRIYSYFTSQGADLAVQEGWTDLVFCGVATESCVLKSAVDAFEREFTPWLVTDASASHGGPAAHDAGLLVARRFIGAGQLIGSDQVSKQFD